MTQERSHNYDVIVAMDKGAKPVYAWNTGIEFEDEAITQLLNLSKLPFIFKHVAAMPDSHAGLGATIGSVIATKGAIIPAAVSVDIGCGVQAVRTNWSVWDIPIKDRRVIRRAIEKAIPHGRSHNGGPGDIGAHGTPDEEVLDVWKRECAPDKLHYLVAKYPELEKANSINHLGTLGTGNHFIEVCLDEDDRVWVMVHSGSRGIGNKIASHFIRIAKKDMERYYIDLPDKDLAYFVEGSETFDDYIKGVRWSQNFAKINRWLMLNRVLKAMEEATRIHCYGKESIIECNHNFVTKENHYGSNVWITRKGAVRAREDDLVIIPGSMGTKSYIAKGLGNIESFNSCSHGAGRKMSRTAARKKFTVEDHIKATEGVECKKDESVLDETPGAYKHIDLVMEAQKDLVEPVHALKAIICVKG